MDVLIEESIDSQAQSESKKSYEFDYYDYEDEYEESELDEEDKGPLVITNDTLKQIERELCLVRLCWPPVNLADSHLSELPESYRTNSDKEKLLMWYAENFRKQFHTIYKDRKPLLLVCDNECGIQKFVSTSIRPSILPYPELYNWQGCAKFVSDHLEYQAPKRPIAMPSALRSPTWLMRVQRGNSFEYSTLLVSLLLAQGYNAFVISGYASREQVNCDMTMRNCPYLPETKDKTPLNKTNDISRYKMKSPPDFRSQLLLDLEAKEQLKIEEELRNQEEKRMEMLLQQERPLPDEYWGNRVHAWVLILPQIGNARQHEILEPFFVESTSGMSYKPNDSKTSLLYHGVESLWNDRNYWVNMQSCSDGCSKINWDLTNIEFWEHLLPGEQPRNKRNSDDDEEIDQLLHIQQEKHLDMPFSYVENIEIHSLDFERRYPNGTKSIDFKKIKVDFYAPYVQMDGLIQKITYYDDYEYRSPIQVYEKYSNRADKLVECKKFHENSIVVDSYERGRSDACKEHRYSADINDRIDEERTLEFYDVVRLDGLSRIETGRLHLTQHFVDRKDFLYYRHVEYAEKRLVQSDSNYRIVTRIIEKYNRNESLSAINDVAIREFAISENEIRLKYHYDKYNITRGTRTFVKPPMADRGDRPLFNPEFVSRYNPDTMAIPEQQLELFYELDKQLKEETKCLAFVADAEQEISHFLNIRRSEFLLPKLTVSSFDRNRNEEAKAGMFAKEDLLRAANRREIEEIVDYLSPYLSRLGNPSHLTKLQASHIRDECLNDLKRTLIDRANYISREFEACSEKLNKLQNWFTQTEGKSREEQERMLNETNEMNFRLHTLDLRLQRHCELSAERYRKMLKMLQADKRLAALYES